MLTIEQLRQEIERIDTAIIEKMAERQTLAEQIGQLKFAKGIAIDDSAREQKLFGMYENLATYYQLPPDFIRDVFDVIIRQSKKVQLAQKPYL